MTPYGFARPDVIDISREGQATTHGGRTDDRTDTRPVDATSGTGRAPVGDRPVAAVADLVHRGGAVRHREAAAAGRLHPLLRSDADRQRSDHRGSFTVAN